MQRHKKSAFTLVELIVVITILAILGTIAFISLQGYSAVSRDSVRISDVGTITTALEVFQINAGKYPLPDQNGIFTYNGETLWTQGLFAGTVINNLSREIGKAPVDPLTDKEYTYSISGNKNEFQILNLLEGELVLNGTTQTNAAESVRTPRVSGTFNGIFVKTKSYLLPIPSIITSLDFNEGDNTAIVSGTGITSQVISGGTNVPKIGNIKSGTGGIEGLSFEPVSISNIVSDSDKATVIDAIKNAYSGSSLKNDGIYEYVLGVSGEENLAGLFDTIVLENFEDIVVNTDTVAPEGGTFVIDEGTGSTSTTSINLTIGCPDENGVEMFISGDVESEDTWRTCTTSRSIILSSLEGEKTVTMKFKDNGDNQTSEVSRSISLVTYSSFSQNGRTWYFKEISGGISFNSMLTECNSIGKRPIQTNWGCTSYSGRYTTSGSSDPFDSCHPTPNGTYINSIPVNGTVAVTCGENSCGTGSIWTGTHVRGLTSTYYNASISRGTNYSGYLYSGTSDTYILCTD